VKQNTTKNCAGLVLAVATAIGCAAASALSASETLSETIQFNSGFTAVGWRVDVVLAAELESVTATVSNTVAAPLELRMVNMLPRVESLDYASPSSPSPVGMGARTSSPGVEYSATVVLNGGIGERIPVLVWVASGRSDYAMPLAVRTLAGSDLSLEAATLLNSRGSRFGQIGDTSYARLEIAPADSNKYEIRKATVTVASSAPFPANDDIMHLTCHAMDNGKCTGTWLTNPESQIVSLAGTPGYTYGPLALRTPRSPNGATGSFIWRLAADQMVGMFFFRSTAGTPLSVAVNTEAKKKPGYNDPTAPPADDSDEDCDCDDDTWWDDSDDPCCALRADAGGNLPGLLVVFALAGLGCALRRRAAGAGRVTRAIPATNTAPRP
jgi:hypothetical protein